MAYTKIHAITATVDKAVAYICNSDKTDEGILISSYGCSPETAAFDFKFSLSKTRQSDINKAYHLIQSFAPGEVSYEEAHQIGNELADKLLCSRYSYIVSTHIDRGHIHNHLIFCAADNISHEKYHDCKQSYYHIRRLSDRLCQEHNLSVIPDTRKKGKSYKEWMESQKNHSWKVSLKTDINEAIKYSSTYKEFIRLMKIKGYEIENTGLDDFGKYIKFRSTGQKRFVRGSEKSLGKDFTRERIRDRIENKAKERTYKLLSSKSIRNIIDISADEKYANHIGLQKWASKQNLKLAAQTYAALNRKGFRSIEELEERILTLSSESSDARSNIAALEKKMRDHSLIIKYAEQYKENKPFYLKYYKAKNKEAVFRKYETQLILYESAKNSLKRMGLQPANINPDEVKADYQTMVQQRNPLSSQYKNAKCEMKELQHLRDTLLQYIENPEKQVSRQQKPNFEGR